MAGILRGLLDLFDRSGKKNEKEHILDGPHMYHVPDKPFIDKSDGEKVRENRKELKDGEWLCSECGTVNSGNFCEECGQKRP